MMPRRNLHVWKGAPCFPASDGAIAWAHDISGVIQKQEIDRFRRLASVAVFNTQTGVFDQLLQVRQRVPRYVTDMKG